MACGQNQHIPVSQMCTGEIVLLRTQSPIVPSQLLMEGNMGVNWKRFHRGWENYVVISRLDQFEECFKTALFLSVIGNRGDGSFRRNAFCKQ